MGNMARRNEGIRDILEDHRLVATSRHGGTCSCGAADYRGYTVNTPYCQALHEEHLADKLSTLMMAERQAVARVRQDAGAI